MLDKHTPPQPCFFGDVPLPTLDITKEKAHHPNNHFPKGSVISSWLSSRFSFYFIFLKCDWVLFRLVLLNFSYLWLVLPFVGFCLPDLHIFRHCVLNTKFNLTFFFLLQRCWCNCCICAAVLTLPLVSQALPDPPLFSVSLFT